MNANRVSAGPYVQAMRPHNEESSRSAPPGFRRRRRILAWLIVAAAAAALAPGWLLPDIGDDGPAISAVNWLSFAIRTFTPHGGVMLLLLFLPVAAARAWRPAAVLAGLGALCILPLLGMGRGGAVLPAGDAPSLTVMTVNVMYGRVRDADLLTEIDRHAPDVVVIQEYSPAFDRRIVSALRERFPHSCLAPRDDAFGMAVFSRLAFVEPAESFPALPRGASAFQPSEPQIRVVVQAGDHEVVVQGVHTLPPVSPRYLSEQRRLCRGLAAYAQVEHRPLVLAGDFNHTPSSAPAAWLRGAGLTDAHSTAGVGRGLTWPASGGVWSIAGFRLDQILVTEGMTVEWCRVGGDIGSDHRPVIARIGFP